MTPAERAIQLKFQPLLGPIISAPLNLQDRQAITVQAMAQPPRREWRGIEPAPVADELTAPCKKAPLCKEMLKSVRRMPKSIRRSKVSAKVAESRVAEHDAAPIVSARAS